MRPNEGCTGDPSEIRKPRPLSYEGWPQKSSAWPDRVARISRRTQWAYSRLRSGDADRFRASQLQHAVQDRDGDVDLGGLTLVCARAQPVADHPLEAADCGLDQRPAVIAGGLLSAHAAVLGDKLQVLIPAGWAPSQPSCSAPRPSAAVQ